MSDIPTLNLNGPNEFVPDFDSFLAKTDDNTEVKTAKKPKTPAETAPCVAYFASLDAIVCLSSNGTYMITLKKIIIENQF